MKPRPESRLMRFVRDMDQDDHVLFFCLMVGVWLFGMLVTGQIQ